MNLDDIITSGYVLDFEDTFEGEFLDRSRWLPNHLPQWSSTTDSAARYELADGYLHLLIEEDQQPWCPELDGSTRVSSLQTGVFAGPVGSSIGQHRFHPAAVVREAQQNLQLYTPHFGVFVLRAKAIEDPNCMVALWMIGYEDRPERSAEICIIEIFGKNVGPASSRIGMGVHPFGDPTLSDDFEEVRLPVDVREFHDYAAQWTRDQVSFFVDGRPVRSVNQAPQYPMQFMLGIYEFGGLAPSNGPYPKRFTIDSFRAYRPVGTA
ncbi:MAG TPA: glycoside hydrolase family 16 protein [Acidimicrobiia bacterium]|nr:glycoside hydrolase family 16 protein [Acidimicrobiia bacterium]